jgi:hypothetical protein
MKIKYFGNGEALKKVETVDKILTAIADRRVRTEVPV